MISANDIQAVLLGAGGFLGATMAGVGVYRMMTSISQRFVKLPDVLDAGVEALRRTAMAIESQSTLAGQVAVMAERLEKVHHNLLEMRDEREMWGRELRIMARRFEGLSLTASDQMEREERHNRGEHASTKTEGNPRGRPDRNPAIPE